MEAKQKANELFERFFFWDTSQGYRDAKRAALIAVDEIMNLENTDWYYWIEVKKEIEKL